ncbi:hypothetical protein EYF80_061780 [Liparis tanakae]|uniref:Uncharacterized protein n=1 Tax=Liparis tanakae TaxID=230148 RepID=A0A4Z2EH10_9TELE|nr:hypothetical protein EYF80_061780 [Liparis tanakae]
MSRRQRDSCGEPGSFYQMCADVRFIITSVYFHHFTEFSAALSVGSQSGSGANSVGSDKRPGGGGAAGPVQCVVHKAHIPRLRERLNPADRSASFSCALAASEPITGVPGSNQESGSGISPKKSACGSRLRRGGFAGQPARPDRRHYRCRRMALEHSPTPPTLQTERPRSFAGHPVRMVLRNQWRKLSVNNNREQRRERFKPT